MIDTNAVSSDKVLSLDASKLTGTLPVSVASSFVQSAATIPGGDLVNSGGSPSTYAAPVIAPLAVTAAKIAANTITDGKLEVAASSTTGIGVDKLRGNTNIGDMVKSNGDYTCSLFTPNKVVYATAPDGAGADDGKAIIVDSGASGTFKYANVNIIGEVDNLLVIPTGGSTTTSVTMTADTVIVGNSNGATRAVAVASTAVTTSGTGPGHLDAGTISTGWWYLWVIYNPTTATVSGIWSTANAWSAVTKTNISGYTYGALVSANYYNGGLTQFYQVNKNIEIANAQVITSTAGVTSWTSLTIPTGTVPSIAKSIRGNMGSSVNNVVVRLEIASNANGYGACLYAGYSNAVTALDSFFHGGTFTVSGSVLYWKAYDTASNYRVTIGGFSI
jgi:hypothetical protein